MCPSFLRESNVAVLPDDCCLERNHVSILLREVLQDLRSSKQNTFLAVHLNLQIHAFAVVVVEFAVHDLIGKNDNQFAQNVSQAHLVAV